MSEKNVQVAGEKILLRRKLNRRQTLFVLICLFVCIYIVYCFSIGTFYYKSGVRTETCDGCFKIPYKFIINEENICVRQGTTGPVVILVVTSQTSDSNHRSVVRSYLGKSVHAYPGRALMVFMLGKSKNEEQNNKIKEESQKYHDIVQSDYLDTYLNLTIKTVTTLKWVTTYCNGARFMVKLDEDVVFNLPLLLEYLTSNEADSIQNSVVGNCHSENTFPVRNPSDKYAVSYEQYQYLKFPPFCSGTAYLMPIPVAKRIYDRSRNIPFLPLEDVYLALVVQNLGITLSHHEKFRLYFGHQSDYLPSDVDYFCKCMISIHDLNDKQRLNAWKFMEENHCLIFASPSYSSVCTYFSVNDIFIALQGFFRMPLVYLLIFSFLLLGAACLLCKLVIHKVNYFSKKLQI